MADSISQYALTDLDRVKSRADIPSGTLDVEIVRLINAISSDMEEYCGRFFRSRVWTHDGTTFPRLNSESGRYLWLRNRPVTTVSTLKILPNGTALTEGYASDFIVHNELGYIELVSGGQFYAGSGIIEITYQGGWQDAPALATAPIYGWKVAGAKIEQACVDAVIDVLHMRDRERSRLVSRSVEGVTSSYSLDTWLPRCKDLLDRHKPILC